jgi:hypothetical protein
MTVRDLAKTYARYWVSPTEYAANGPAEYRLWLRNLPPHMSTEDAFQSTMILAGSETKPPMPGLRFLLTWTEAHWPRSTELADSILASKKPPKTYTELLERVYTTARADAVDATRAFIKQQLAAF